MRNMQSDDFRNDTERAQAATNKLRKQTKIPDNYKVTFLPKLFNSQIALKL